MANQPGKIQSFNVVIVAQGNRLQYEAVLFAASFRATNPDFPGRFIVAIPENGPLWDEDPSLLDEDVLAMLRSFGAEILYFPSIHFGQTYPNGNKLEMLAHLPEGEPFVFFDTDTVILNDLTQVPFDFDRPAASTKVEGTWPVLELYGPGYTEIWEALYDHFGLDFESSLDISQPDEYWRRYLYFNAGFFFFRCPVEFGQRFLSYALEIRDDTPDELVCQPLNPWLDQIALPLVIHSFGGGRGALPSGYLDGSHSCHYRFMALMFAREDDAAIDLVKEVAAPNKVKKILKRYEPFKHFIYQSKGDKARRLFDQSDLPKQEKTMRRRLRNHGLWVR